MDLNLPKLELNLLKSKHFKKSEDNLDSNSLDFKI